MGPEVVCCERLRLYLLSFVYPEVQSLGEMLMPFITLFFLIGLRQDRERP